MIKQSFLMSFHKTEKTMAAVGIEPARKILGGVFTGRFNEVDSKANCPWVAFERDGFA